MKNLSTKELERRNLARKAVTDYFGYFAQAQDRITKAIIIRKYKGLNEEDTHDVLHILSNMADPTYYLSLQTSRKNDMAKVSH